MDTRGSVLLGKGKTGTTQRSPPQLPVLQLRAWPHLMILQYLGGVAQRQLQNPAEDGIAIACHSVISCCYFSNSFGTNNHEPLHEKFRPSLLHTKEWQDSCSEAKDRQKNCSAHVPALSCVLRSLPYVNISSSS